MTADDAFTAGAEDAAQDRPASDEEARAVARRAPKQATTTTNGEGNAA